MDEEKDYSDNDSDTDIFTDTIKGTDKVRENNASRRGKKRKVDKRAWEL